MVRSTVVPRATGVPAPRAGPDGPGLLGRSNATTVTGRVVAKVLLVRTRNYVRITHYYHDANKS